jgi:hypothetical protein
VAELTKKDAEKAYQAGRALASVNWDQAIEMHDDMGKGVGIDDAKARGRLFTPGVHHCPFAEDDPQRKHWLRGLRERLAEPTQDPAAIIAEIDKELK